MRESKNIKADGIKRVTFCIDNFSELKNVTIGINIPISVKSNFIG